ncbi:hypothetical protein V5799_006912 [Amblyomma americanum]|uniref:Uncharacterized protein n=1 Tax=Amblyomma americanum TaxID=6943 RepID=A0AAQ4DV16_AMBAM
MTVKKKYENSWKSVRTSSGKIYDLIRCSACLKIIYTVIDKKFDDVHLCSHASASTLLSNLSITAAGQFAASQC